VTHSSLHDSPFWLLGATVRDSRPRIVALAEEKALQLDSGICERARSELTNPRTRLKCEIAWLPGLAPGRAQTLLSLLSRDAFSAKLATGLPHLAYANLVSAQLEAIPSATPLDEFVDSIEQLARAAEDLSTDEVLRSINEDRMVAGFPEVKSLEQVEEELTARKRQFRDVLKQVLNRLPSGKLIDVMTGVVQSATDGGTTHATALVDTLVDSYEVESQEFLHKELANVQRLIVATREAADAGKDVQPLIDKLILVTTNWQRVAKPIQVSSKARGIEHRASVDLAFSVRSLAVDLFNLHDLLKPAQQLTALLGERFSEVPAAADKVSEDKAKLEEISAEREELKELTPLRELWEAAMKNSESDPKSADIQAQQLLATGQRALTKLESDGASRAILSRGRNGVAGAMVGCVIAYANATSNWTKCVPLLQSAHDLANDADLLKHIAKNLDIARANDRMYAGLEPISGAPSLWTLNGIGTTLYGSSDHDRDSGSFISTYYLVFFFVPVVPLARYRVIQNGKSYRFLGKAPLRTFDKWHIAIAIALVVWLFVGKK